MGNLVQHIWHFRDKMVIYSYNDPIKCLTFLHPKRSSLRVVLFSTVALYPQFYGGHRVILIQYTSHQEAKRNSHHLLLIEMRQEDSLKLYINFFQSQLTKVSNCGEEDSTLAFISRLQVTHPLYKHVLKYNVAKISEVHSRALSYIQLEEAMKASSNCYEKPGDGEAKSKYPHEAFDHIQDRFWRQPSQEASTHDPPSKSTLRLQINGTLYSTEAPSQ